MFLRSFFLAPRVESGGLEDEYLLYSAGSTSIRQPAVNLVASTRSGLKNGGSQGRGACRFLSHALELISNVFPFRGSQKSRVCSGQYLAGLSRLCHLYLTSRYATGFASAGRRLPRCSALQPVAVPKSRISLFCSGSRRKHADFVRHRSPRGHPG